MQEKEKKRKLEKRRKRRKKENEVEKRRRKSGEEELRRRRKGERKGGTTILNRKSKMPRNFRWSKKKTSGIEQGEFNRQAHRGDREQKVKKPFSPLPFLHNHLHLPS